jgi:hypothetical protein
MFSDLFLENDSYLSSFINLLLIFVSKSFKSKKDYLSTVIYFIYYSNYEFIDSLLSLTESLSLLNYY